MTVVINDANILIDLAELDLLAAFSQLRFELHTTDFVVAELNEEQQASVNNSSHAQKVFNPSFSSCHRPAPR